MMSAASKCVENCMRMKLQNRFNPTVLRLINESHMHNVPAESETHFKVIIVSDEFKDMPVVKVHTADPFDSGGKKKKITLNNNNLHGYMKIGLKSLRISKIRIYPLEFSYASWIKINHLETLTDPKSVLELMRGRSSFSTTMKIKISGPQIQYVQLFMSFTVSLGTLFFLMQLSIELPYLGFHPIRALPPKLRLFYYIYLSEPPFSVCFAETPFGLRDIGRRTAVRSARVGDRGQITGPVERRTGRKQSELSRRFRKIDERVWWKWPPKKL